MKIIILGCIILPVLFCSCGNKKTKLNPFEPLTELIDSVKTQKSFDTLTIENDLPVRVKADESFNDFIYSFATDEKLQRSRVIFPLPFYNCDSASKIEKKYWKHDPLYTTEQFYTLIFDKERDIELAQDTSLNSVCFEWIYMNTQVMKRYYFERIEGIWMLQAIDLHQIDNEENKEFIEFIYKFVNDAVFQSKHIADPLIFVTTDPDDDFSILETTLDASQWSVFMPPLPKNKLTNINYGQKNLKESPYKILAIKGIGNGFSNMLYFRKEGNEWNLYKFEDLGD